MSSDSDLAQRFRHEVRALMEERIGITLVIGACIFPIYVFEDQWLCGDDWPRVFALRLICSLTCILGVALNHTRWVRRNTFSFIVLMMTVVAVLKAFTTAVDVSGIRSLYFGGHALILAGSLAYLPLNGWQALIVGGACVGGYAAPTLLFADPLEHIPFQIQVGLLSAIWLQLAIGCHLNHKLRQREFAFRSRLHAARRRAEDYGF